jgi:hypothetical protein
MPGRPPAPEPPPVPVPAWSHIPFMPIWSHELDVVVVLDRFPDGVVCVGVVPAP